MDSYSYSLFLFFILLSNPDTAISAAPDNIFSVTDFGAIPDGKTDTQNAFSSAWQKACGVVKGTVWVPAATFFLSRAEFNGPCNGPTYLVNHGTLVASGDPTLGGPDSWISFTRVNSLKVVGNGVFDGNGATSWSLCRGRSGGCHQYLRPYTMKISFVRNAIIGRGLRFINSKMFHISIYGSTNVHVDHVQISAPGDSPNTDGIHVALSGNTRVTDSTISTGDDCISIGDGCNVVNITGVFCGPGHGISIGSLGKYPAEKDVSRVALRNCTFKGTDNGVRIKTWARSSPALAVSEVTAEDIVVDGVKNPVIIDQFYCPDGGCGGGGQSGVQIRGVKIGDVRGTSETMAAVSLNCSRKLPCRNIEFRGLNLTYQGRAAVALCANAEVFFGGSDQVPSRCSSG